MFSWKNTSVNDKLMVILLCISAIAVVLTSFSTTASGIISLRERMKGDIELTSSVAAFKIAPLLKTNQKPEQVEHVLETFVSGNESLRPLTRLCVYKPEMYGDFREFVSHNRSVAECPNPREILGNEGQSFYQGKFLRVYQPVTLNDEKLGFIFVESDLSEVNEFIKQQIITAVLIIVIVLGISYLLARRLQKTISRPIMHLVQTTRRVAQERDYSIRAKNFLQGNDVKKNEISILIDAFNNMLNEMEERKQVLLRKNQELVYAKDAADNANRAKSQFLANMTHELRTPLNAIIGFSDMIKNQLLGDIDQKYVEYGNDINKSGEQLLQIINDILDLTKAEAGKIEPVLRELNLKKIIPDCVNAFTQKAEEGQLTLTTELPEELPNLVSDRGLLKRVLTNLLSNSVKFTPAGGSVTVSVTTRLLPDNRNEFLITIADTGIGMSRADIELAFKSFMQVDGGLDRKYEGTGLGLPLTKKLVEVLGGSLHFDSKPGEGTKAIMKFFS